MGDKKLAAAANAKGNAAFKAQSFEEAVRQFTEAITHDPTHHVFYSNRSACYVCLKRHEKAMEDGKKCVELKPDWPKGYARKGLAELMLKRYEDAAETYRAGLRLAQEDVPMLEGLKKAVDAQYEALRSGVGGKGCISGGGMGETMNPMALLAIGTSARSTPKMSDFGMKVAVPDSRPCQQQPRLTACEATALEVEWSSTQSCRSIWPRSIFRADEHPVTLQADSKEGRRVPDKICNPSGAHWIKPDASSAAGCPLASRPVAKQAPDDAGAPQDLVLRQRIMKRMKNNVWLLDPAQNEHALEAHKHLVEYIEVTNLLQTHDRVSTRFGHGTHRGQSVDDLSKKLVANEVEIESITPLVAVRLDGLNYVVFGNRRLHALKKFQRLAARPVSMRCIVHDFDGRAPVPHALVAKLLDAATSRNGGAEARFSTSLSYKTMAIAAGTLIAFGCFLGWKKVKVV